MGAAVRSVNRKHIIFYEPVTWGMVEEGRYSQPHSSAFWFRVLWSALALRLPVTCAPRYLGSGLSAVPGGAQWANLSCLSYHFYCASFGGSRSLCDGVVEPDVFRSMRDEVSPLRHCDCWFDAAWAASVLVSRCKNVLVACMQ